MKSSRRPSAAPVKERLLQPDVEPRNGLKRKRFEGRRDLLGDAAVAAPRADWGEAEDEESSDCPEANGQDGRKTKRLVQETKRKKRHRGDGINADPDVLSLLERNAVQPGTDLIYKSHVLAFLNHAEKNKYPLLSEAEVDARLVQKLNRDFLRGYEVSKGTQLMAGWMHYYPEYGRAGSKRTPRSWRAIKGWKRLAPPRSRWPRGFPAVAAMAVELCRRGRRDMGAWAISGHGGYLRPSENLRLREVDMIPPSPGVTPHWTFIIAPEEGLVPTKANQFDDTVIWDLPYLKFMDQIFAILRGRGSNSLVWGFTYPELLAEWKPAAEAIHMKEFVPYELRHSGPSWERLQQMRTLEAVWKRGRWLSRKNVLRYEKAGRLHQEMQKLGEPVRRHYRTCVSLLAECILGLVKPPAPPPRV